MLNTNKMKEFAQAKADIKLITLESMDGEQCYVKKFTMGDTMAFRKLSEDETVITMILIGVVDEAGCPLFPSIDAVQEMPVSVVTELLGHVSDHNVGAEVEDQAKK